MERAAGGVLSRTGLARAPRAREGRSRFTSASSNPRASPFFPFSFSFSLSNNSSTPFATFSSFAAAAHLPPGEHLAAYSYFILPSLITILFLLYFNIMLSHFYTFYFTPSTLHSTRDFLDIKSHCLCLFFFPTLRSREVL